MLLCNVVTARGFSWVNIYKIFSFFVFYLLKNIYVIFLDEMKQEKNIPFSCSGWRRIAYVARTTVVLDPEIIYALCSTLGLYMEIQNSSVYRILSLQFSNRSFQLT